jgi:proteasome lid subunit RPN8/RPN11
MTPKLKQQIIAHGNADSPREACGLLVMVGDALEYVPCRNMADGNETFILDPRDYKAASARGNIQAVVHTHPFGIPEPSQADRVACEASGLPWHIVTIPDEKWTYLAPCGYEAPLLGRTWVHGVLDCYSLIRDWYKQERRIVLPDFDRQTEWWYKGYNLYIDNFRKAGFEVVEDEKPEPGDVLLMQVLANVPNHGAIYLENDIILHHLYNRLSCREVFGGYYRKHCTHVLRYKG